jgi:hypothetical protein
MRGSYLAFLVTAAASLAACSVYDSSLKDGFNPSPGGGGGGQTSGGGGSGEGGGSNTGAVSSTGGGGATGCQHLTYPPLPTDLPPESDAGDRNLSFVAVMYDIDLGDGPPNADPPSVHYLDLGYDLDNTCTTAALKNDPKGYKCVLPDFSSGATDGPDGQDNALGKNIQFIRDHIDNFSSAIYSKGLYEGRSANILIDVSGYNGEANDGKVRVATMVAADFQTIASNKGAKPKWDGTDIWPIASDSVINGDRDKPKFVDEHAYVNNYQLVVTLPEAQLRLITGLTDAVQVNLNVFMRAATTTCTITQTDAGTSNYELRNCRLSARWEVNDILHQLSQFPDPLALPAFAPQCNVPGTGSAAVSYNLFKRSLCGVVDTYSGIAGPTTVCNALSMGIAFNTKPGRLGSVFTVDPITPKCVDPATKVILPSDPSFDNCELPQPVAAGGAGGKGGAGGTGGSSAGGSGGTKLDGGTPDASDAGH